MDKFKIDSHKLMYHVGRVAQWLNGRNVYPIYVEIGLSHGCNHRCIFCAFDFLKHRSEILESNCLKRFIVSATNKGVKAVLYSGEGEPLLYRNIVDVVGFTKKSGIDVAISTNGINLKSIDTKKLLEHLTWLRVSIDASTAKTYGVVHGTDRNDFNIVMKNLQDAVRVRDKYNYACTIGAQFLLVPQNYKEVVGLTKMLSSIGIDYLVVKPYSFHPSSKNKLNTKFKRASLSCLKEKVEKYSMGDFKVIFRQNSMAKLEEFKPYRQCMGLPFATHVTASGDVYPCNFFIGKKEFVFGNIYKKSFENIWEGQRRKKIMEFIRTKWNVSDCRKSCRLDEINNYLWQIKNPCRHVNFI